MIIVIATPASVPLLITNNCTYSKARSSPKAVTLISIDLVQGLPDVHPAPLELDVHHWDAVDENGHVIAVVTGADDLVLVDDLQGVVVDALLVDQVDVFRCAIVALEHLDMKRLKPDVGQYQGARRMNLHPMTSDSLELLAAARHGVEVAWCAGFAYTKAGIMPDDLIAAGLRLRTLFEGDVDRRDRLMTALDEVNGRLGRSRPYRRARASSATGRCGRRTSR